MIFGDLSQQFFFSKYKGLLNDLPKQATRNLSGINFQLNIQTSFSSSYHGSLYVARIIVKLKTFSQVPNLLNVFNTNY